RLGPHGRRPREPVAAGPGAGQARRPDLRAADPPGSRSARGPGRCAPDSDEHAPYATAIREVYGVETPRPRRPGPGRPPKPVKVVPPDVCGATARERREKGRVVDVMRTLVFGTRYLLGGLLRRSTASTT